MHPLFQESPSVKPSIATTIAINEYDDNNFDDNCDVVIVMVVVKVLWHAPIVAEIAFSEVFTSNKNSHCHQGKACLHPSETW